LKCNKEKNSGPLLRFCPKKHGPPLPRDFGKNLKKYFNVDEASYVVTLDYSYYQWFG
jgi:hypothetical protein